MTLEAALPGWYPVARLRDLKHKRPIRVVLFGTPLVVFGTPDAPHVLRDRCPHRGAALSDGRTDGNTVTCPYHGWAFDGAGALQRVPCLIGDVPAIRAQAFETTTAMGLVFVKIGEVEGEPYVNTHADTIRFWRPLPGGAKGSLADAAENYLDVTHTHSVHPNILRREKRAGTTRTRVVGTAEIDRAELHYHGEGKAGGVVGTLMGERDRALSVGRFVGPNVAEVEFHGPKGPRFIMTGYLAPVGKDEVGGFGVVGLPGPLWWAWLKFLVFYPFICLVHAQDKAILGRVTANRGRRFRNVIGPLDFMRPQIDAILAGKTPPAKDAPFEVEIDL